MSPGAIDRAVSLFGLALCLFGLWFYGLTGRWVELAAMLAAGGAFVFVLVVVLDAEGDR